jgi:hypothetical protein
MIVTVVLSRVNPTIVSLNASVVMHYVQHSKQNSAVLKKTFSENALAYYIYNTCVESLN